MLPEDGDDFADANSYLPFKALDTLVTKHIVEELDNIPELDEERESLVLLIAPLWLLPVEISAMSASRCTHESSVLCVYHTITEPRSDIFLDINRMLNPSIPSTTATDAQASPPEPRILILSVSPDLSTSYIPLMNSIFSAQKLVRKIPSSFRMLLF